VAVAVAGALRPVKGYNFEWRDSSQYKCNRKCNHEIPQKTKKRRSYISGLEGFLLFARQKSKMKFFSLL